jgi:hypothetical protein
MAIDIEVRDYNSASDRAESSSCAYGDIHYTGRASSDRTYVRDPDSDGDAYFATTNFGWWIGCQHAIKLTWSSGEEVILKPDRNVKIKKDKEAQRKILDYLRRLIDNKLKYMPFGEPEIKLELSGAEAEFMDI